MHDGNQLDWTRRVGVRQLLQRLSVSGNNSVRRSKLDPMIAFKGGVGWGPSPVVVLHGSRIDENGRVN